MNILDEIVSKKKAFLASHKLKHGLSSIKESALYGRETYSLSKSLSTRKASIISEFKRKSPSRSDIKVDAKVEDIVELYQDGGASAISVLTDGQHFGGSSEDLTAARGLVDLPLLRKDFIVDEYQIHEAKAIGADLILLIAYCLSKSQAEEYTALAHELGLEVLFEIHDMQELSTMPGKVDILGVNNRNLTSFVVDYKYAIEVYKDLPEEKIKISESGILNLDSYVETIHAGYKACLIGEFLMKENDPKKTIDQLITAATL